MFYIFEIFALRLNPKGFVSVIYCIVVQRPSTEYVKPSQNITFLKVRASFSLLLCETNNKSARKYYNNDCCVHNLNIISMYNVVGI